MRLGIPHWWHRVTHALSFSELRLSGDAHLAAVEWDRPARVLLRTGLSIAYMAVLFQLGVMLPAGRIEADSVLAGWLLLSAGVITLPLFIVAMGKDVTWRAWSLAAAFVICLPYLILDPAQKLPGMEIMAYCGGLVLPLHLALRVFAVSIPLAGVVVWANSSFAGGLLQFSSLALVALLSTTLGWVVSESSQLRLARALLIPSALEAERLRVARDLHDTLGNTLIAAVAKGSLAEIMLDRSIEVSRAELKETQLLLRNALKETRAVAMGYREADLDTELETAENLLTGIGMKLERIGDTSALPAHARGPSAYLIREAVTNIVKHSRARVVSVTCEAGEVSVVDDGEEPVQMEPAGVGLIGLAERIGMAGGMLTFGPTGERGFMVRAFWPARDGGDL
ncbi:sensor histidine kinase [Luethyella okanaganae]|uniref:Sensor histidine kinase n=1 Tax=Luethyella okanaganae TaxID=69372 RepID=A0ABW1VE21_9MICO